jgi:glycosyltransferase involved in cell wall biosynthesis
MTLSILIRTIPGREAKLADLLSVLNPQLTPEVEVIVDDTYPQTMGAKGNVLVSNAKGEYVVFIDDDDLVPDYYVARFLEVINRDHPDCISIEGVCHLMPEGGREIYRYRQALHNQVWGFMTPTLLLTDLTQIGAVKRSISLQCPFPDIQYYDDRVFAEQLKTVAKSESHIRETMYIHQYTPVKEYKY